LKLADKPSMDFLESLSYSLGNMDDNSLPVARYIDFLGRVDKHIPKISL
jgi:hypothetical protein